MDFLHHHFTQIKNKASSNPRFYARFHFAWLKFEEYYQLTEQAPVYVAGIVGQKSIAEARPQRTRTFLEHLRLI